MLTNLDPAVILWETLPYSFVVDWFFDIGGFLSTRAALSNLSSIQISNAFQTRTELRKTEYDFAPTAFHGTGTTVSFSGGYHGSSVRKLLNRTVLGSTLPEPKIPMLNFKGSLTKYANALALLSQLFQK
jgi:hypothetical protein